MKIFDFFKKIFVKAQIEIKDACGKLRRHLLRTAGK